MGVNMKCHFVPKVILRGFDNEKTEQVWTYFPNREPFKQSIHDAAAENGLYLIQDNGERKDPGLETFFSIMEGRLGDVIRALQQKKMLGIEEREKIGQYVALQIVRTPAYKNALLDSFSGMNERQLTEHIEKTFDHVPTGINSNDVPETPPTPESRHAFFLGNLLDEITKKWPQLALRKYRVLHTTAAYPFITSSSGIGIDCMEGNETVSFSDEHAIIFLPLSSTIAVEMTGFVRNRTDLFAPHVKATSIGVKEVNNAVAYSTDRYVIGSGPNYKLPKVWCKSGMKVTPKSE
ncbi:MAG: DUF4238 domain-containing protein [Planctomycetes bacterium]|nr:DUF4238 domain-containing protein [Planctomycetota bacterium]